MTTLAEMIETIEDDTERSDTDAIRKKILAAIRHYQPKRFFFNEALSVSFNTVASQGGYSFQAIGTEFYKIDGVFLVNGSNISELERVNYTSLEDEPDTTEGVPERYGYVAKTIRLFPTPAAAYETRLTGHIKVDEPGADDEADNPWMVEAFDLIMARAKAELFAHRWEDPSNAAIMRAAEGDALNRLQAATHDKVALGYLEATDF